MTPDTSQGKRGGVSSPFTIDRRRRVRWVNFVLSGIFGTFGSFALMSEETGFTMALAEQGIEFFWGALLCVMAVFHFLIAFSMTFDCKRCASKNTCLVLLNGASSVIMLWTWMMVGLIGGLYTPTVIMCMWLAVALAVMTIAEARTSVKIRLAQHYGYSSE